jgi:hypothetical protein
MMDIENGTDIDRWTLAELTDVTQAFQKQNEVPVAES